MTWPEICTPNRKAFIYTVVKNQYYYESFTFYKHFLNHDSILINILI